MAMFYFLNNIYRVTCIGCRGCCYNSCYPVFDHKVAVKPHDIQYMKTCHEDKHTDIPRLFLRLTIRKNVVLYNVTFQKVIFINVNGYRFIINSYRL